MKRRIRMTLYSMVSGAVLLLPSAGFANVCSQGVGIPPFLSSGARPNLLMVLDNSGSMLDAAYNDATSFCFDDTYDTTATYGGYFEQDRWYKWVGPGTDASYADLPPWQSSTSYDAGDRVYANGIIWEALTSDTSSGDHIGEDIGVAWTKISTGNNKWANGVSYTAGDIVWFGPQLYQATTTATSNDPDDSNGLNLEDDQGVTWEAVDSTWVNGKSYSADDVVSYKGSLYSASSDGTSSGTGVYDDSGVDWDYLKEGSFVEVGSDEAASYCSGASGSEKYTHDDLCISFDTSKNPDQVSAFAARGGFLNWAMASKFDVEKKILTGGRYNYKDDLMMTEHRGCSGSLAIKQIQMDGDPEKFLSLAIRGSRYDDGEDREDRVDSTDDTGRLEIWGVTDDGYAISPECQSAMERIASHGLNGSQNEISSCIESFPAGDDRLTAMRPVLNHSLQVCWQSKINNGHVNTLTSACEELYETYHPSELIPADGGPYICYGVYDSGVDHMNRTGYMGRVWVQGDGGGITMKTCNPRAASGECSGTDCCWAAGPVDDSTCLNYRNNADGYVEQCTASSGGGTETCGPQEANGECSGTNCCWGGDNEGDPNQDCITYRNNADGHVEECTRTKGKGTDKSPYTCSNWEVKEVCVTDGAVCTQWEILGEWSDGSGTCDYGVDDPVEIGGDGSSAGDWEESPSTSEGNGVYEAISDYCDSFSYPEVIDPSENAAKTSETGNVPALLRDSELMSQLGSSYAMTTMKGYISEDDRPQGVIQTVAGDLRLGAMAFHYVGAAAECQLAAGDADSKIDKYCPENNRDGAMLLGEIDSGDLVVDDADLSYPDNDNKRRHVDDIAQAINDTRASSWTPLGEAMYGALGYYTQNASLCLNVDDDGNCIDYPVCLNYDEDQNCTDTEPVDDPVQYWCQDNHILVITEGESTNDIHGDVTGFPEDNDTRFLSLESGDNLEGDTGADNIEGCDNGLYSSTFFDDMTWWGQYVYPLYRHRYVVDPDGNYEPKQNITTHIVTTGTLTEDGDGECSPKALMEAAAVNGGTDAYYPGENPEELEDNLYAVLGDIMSRASSGSAASVISDSRSGSGAMYQAVFWPEHEDNATPEPNKVTWVGDVRALLLDANGVMYEDTDQDGVLDSSADNEIVFYYSNNVNKTRGCYNTDDYYAGPDGTEGTADDYQCPGDLDPEREPCLSDPTSSACSWVAECTEADDCVETMDVLYLWSANRQLREMDVLTDRKVYTWTDLNNDGIVDSGNGEWFQLNDSTDWSGLNTTAATEGKRGPVTGDFLTSDDWATFVGSESGDAAEQTELNALQALTRWLLGEDQLDDETSDSNGNGWIDRKLRSRQYAFTDTGLTQEWRLGDVIHSAPTAVSKPAESYHQIYRDPTYSDFALYWDNRRIVIYFGGNDGMLHAVNGGFYLEDEDQFCCTEPVTVTEIVDGQETEVTKCLDPLVDGMCSGTDLPNLGEELWAYIPYNLQPHLKCLADEFYDHKYYVDLKPRMFDVQIFAEESACNAEEPTIETGCIHPGGWGTILVGGMRFGGTPVDAMDLNSFTDNDGFADPRQFTSSFFILDITNPEAPPVLLGELTRNSDDSIGVNNSGDAVKAADFLDLNYTTSSPAMIVMRDGETNDVSSKWYLVMGNGPSGIDGTNAKNEQGKLAILPLDWLKGPALGWSDGIPSTNGTKQAVRIPNDVPGADGGGVYTVPLADNASYISDIISVDYEISANAPDDLGVRYRTDAIYFGTADGTWHPEYPDDYYVTSGDQRYWNGGGRLFRLVTKVLDSSGEEQASDPMDWAGAWSDGDPVRMLLDLKAPMVAPPSVGFDGYNYWIYGGTGRFYDELDKTDDGRCLPVDAACLEPGACEESACLSDPACSDACEGRSNMAYFGLKEPFKDDKTTSFEGWSNPLSSITDIDCYRADSPLDTDGLDPFMTWGTINWDLDDFVITNGLVTDFANIPNQKLQPSLQPGMRGLMQTDNILVGNKTTEEGNSVTGYLACWRCYMDGDTFMCDSLSEDACYAGVPSYPTLSTADDPDSKGPVFDYEVGEQDENGDYLGEYTFDKLTDYIAGTGCQEVGGENMTTGLDGWYHVFHDPRERNISTASLLGDMLYFTTYQPFNDICKAEGQSFLYGLYYQTGTASADDVLGTLDPDSADEDGTPITSHGDPDPLKYNSNRLLMPGLVMPPTLHGGPEGLKAILTDAAGKTETKDVGDEDGIRSGRVNWSDQHTD